MKHRILGAFLFCCLFFSLLAKATPLDDKVDVLKKAVKAEIADKYSKAMAEAASTPGGSQRGNYPGVINPGGYDFMLGQLASQIDHPEQGNPEMTIQQILSTFSSDAVQKAGQDLLAEIRSERQAKQDAYVDQVQAVLKRVPDVLLNAKKPEDIDGILVDLQKFQNNRGNYGNMDRDAQLLSQDVNAAFQFANNWQDYVAHRNDGQIDQAQNDLRNMTQNSYAVTIIPRSVLLARSAELAKSAVTPGSGKSDENGEPGASLSNIINNIKTLDDMGPALEQIRALQAKSNNFEVQQTSMALSQLVQSYSEVKAGLPSNINLGSWFSGPNTTVSTINVTMNAKLLAFFLRHYFELPEPAAPNSDENPRDLVNGVIKDAESREDWHLLRKALEIQAYFDRTSNFGPPSAATAGIQSLLAGLTQETASQYSLAVVSYEGALKSGDSYIPAKMIGDRLISIQKDHPKEFESGMQMFVSPPYPSYSYPQGVIPGMSYRSAMTGSIFSIPGMTTNTPVSDAPATLPSPIIAPSTNAAPIAPAPPSK